MHYPKCARHFFDAVGNRSPNAPRAWPAHLPPQRPVPASGIGKSKLFQVRDGLVDGVLQIGGCPYQDLQNGFHRVDAAAARGDHGCESLLTKGSLRKARPVTIKTGPPVLPDAGAEARSVGSLFLTKRRPVTPLLGQGSSWSLLRRVSRLIWAIPKNRLNMTEHKTRPGPRSRCLGHGTATHTASASGPGGQRVRLVEHPPVLCNTRPALLKTPRPS